jgi:hypothetical protein
VLYLVRHPHLPKRIQVNAESGEAACVWLCENISPEVNKGASPLDCEFTELEDPMDQFVSLED